MQFNTRAAECLFDENYEAKSTRIAITGAATGIGAEVVTLMRAEEHHITAFDVMKPATVDTWVEVDLSDMEAIAKCTADLEGPFDVLINNAGLPPRAGNQAKLLAVNVFGMRAMMGQRT